MFSRIITVAKKEMLHVRRDPRLIATIFGMPLIQLILFSYALSFDIKNISTAVLDNDRSQLSRRFTGAFTNSGYFKITGRPDSRGQIDKVIDSGSAKVAITIPPDFSRRLTAGRRAAVQIIIGSAEPNTAVIARTYATVITEQFSRRLFVEALEKRGPAGPLRLAPPLEARSRIWYNPSGRSVVFILPGLIVVIMTNVAMMQTALAVVREKDQGTLEQLIVSPVRSHELMIGKIMPFFLMALIDMVIVSAVGIFIFQVPLNGSVALLALGSTLFTLAALGFGLFVSSVSATMESAAQLSFFVSMLPAFILSGFIWPLENMPAILQGISYLFPARYFMTLIRGVFLKGVGLDILWPQFLALFLFATLAIGLAAANLKERTG